MGERERNLVDPRAPVVLTAKVPRTTADEIFGKHETLSKFLIEASGSVCALMKRMGVEEVTLTLDELMEGQRVARHLQRQPYLDGLKLSLVGQHEQTEHEGPPGEPNGEDKSAENQT